MFWLVALTLVLQATEVTGLSAGETAVVVDAADWFDADAAGNYLHPRVLDARTGTPLAGVAIETWSEAGVEPFRAEIRLDQALTGGDGSARVRYREGVGHADKIRLSKAGYASNVVGTSDVHHAEIRLYPALALTGRVLNVDGLPVAGAIVRSRETCAHAVPATQTRTDALGRFELADLPPLAEGLPELEVVEGHHEPLFQLEIIELLHQRAEYGSLELYVARRRPVTLEVVDARGVPQSGRHVTTNTAPVTQAWTGPDGRCTLLPSIYPFESTYFLEEAYENERAMVALFVDGLISRVSSSWAAKETLKGRASVRIEGLNEGERAPPIVFAPEHTAFLDVSNATPLALPLGPARVHVGGDFTGWRKEARDVVIGETSTTIDFAPRRELRLTITSKHWQALTRLVAQAGDHSITNPNSAIADEETRAFPLPADVPITIFGEFADGTLRRVSLPPLTVDARIDLDAAENVLRPALSSAPRTVTLRFTVRDTEGNRLAGAVGGLDASNLELEATSDSQGLIAWPIPASLPYRVAIRAEGCTLVRYAGIAPSAGDAGSIDVVVTRRAHLELRGNVAQVKVGGTEPDQLANGFALDVAAGPLTLCIERHGKPALALDLVLAPGERRSIDVH